MIFKPLTLFGYPIFENAEAQIQECLKHPNAVAGALMADHHLGYAMPIGGVIAYEGAVSPTGVGFDIACGNMAVRTDLTLESIGGQQAIKSIMREIQRKVAFGMGRNNPTPVDHALFDSPAWDELEEQIPDIKALAARQLGTVGSGNHYVDLLIDSKGLLWIANHFGSRGLGHKTASLFMELAPKPHTFVRDKDSIVLPTDTDLGQFYIQAMELAGEYAYAGREYVVGQVLEILGSPKVTQTVHNHHNFAWQEDGLWIVRKGATPLTDSPAFIGGSMGDASVIVRGRPSCTCRCHETGWEVVCGSCDCFSYPGISDLGNLGSAPHGAGRVMSRNEAAGKIRKYWVCPNRNCKFEPERSKSGDSGYTSNHCPQCGIPLRRERIRDTSDAKIDWDAARALLTSEGVVVLGAGADEAPGVYKSLQEVIGSHSNIEILETLQPVGVVMAGSDEHDPYKD